MINQLHSRLRLLRKEKELTQAQLSEALLLPRVTYTHYELGKRTPDLDMIIQMARFFNVTVDFLIGNVDSREWQPAAPYDRLDEKRLIGKIADLSDITDYGDID